VSFQEPRRKKGGVFIADQHSGAKKKKGRECLPTVRSWTVATLFRREGGFLSFGEGKTASVVASPFGEGGGGEGKRGEKSFDAKSEADRHFCSLFFCGGGGGMEVRKKKTACAVS